MDSSALLERRLGLGLAGPRRLEGDLVRLLVDHQQELPLLDHRPLGEVALGEEPADAGPDRHVLGRRTAAAEPRHPPTSSGPEERTACDPNRPPAVIVLAAGGGTRMKSATPKVLHRIGGRTLLGHSLAAARGVDPEHLVVVVRQERDLVAATCRRSSTLTR